MSGDEAVQFFTKILLAVMVGFGTALTWLWSTATGAKRCASQAQNTLARVDQKLSDLRNDVRELKDTQADGFKALHERVDKLWDRSNDA